MTREIDALRQVFVGQPRPAAWPERRARMDAIGTIDPRPVPEARLAPDP